MSRAKVSDVAKLAGVSPSTVSYAFSGSRPIGEAVRKRVFDAAAELGYKPFLPAKTMGGGRVGAIGLIVSFFKNPATGEILDCFAAELKAKGFKALVCGVGGDYAEARASLSYLASGLVDGIVNMHSNLGVNETKVICGATPCVTYLRPHPDSPAYVDYIGGTALLLEHLWSLGHRSIGIIEDPGARPPENGEEMKLAAYRQFLSSKGCEVQESLALSGDMSFETGYKCGALLRERGATAVFAPSDSSALGVLAWAADAGVRIPEDISVASYDNTRLSTAANPPLTGLRQPSAELARATVEAIAAIVEGKEPEPQKIFKPCLIARKSTGPAPAAK